MGLIDGIKIAASKVAEHLKEKVVEEEKEVSFKV